MDHSEYKAKTKESIREILQLILEDKIGLIVGARKLCSLRYELGESFEPYFQYFVAVDSETDHFFLEVDEQVKVCESYITRMESEVDAYQKAEWDAKNAACEKLLELLL